MASNLHTHVPGRGAGSNHQGRFEKFEREELDDGWDTLPDDPATLRTSVSMETARRIITYNRSPDLPFDRSINPYRGCEHGCVYCFARPTHAYLGLSPGLDFESRLIARPNAANALRGELTCRAYTPATIAIGTNTDPYQPIEQRLGIARACLEVLAETKHPVAITTKGTLIERDIDILSQMAALGLVRVGVSVTTLDPKLSRQMEPRAPSPKRRLMMIERLSAAGVPVRIMASPMVPALTDPELEMILKAGAEAGASHASWIMLRLPREVSQLWKEWLTRHYPDRVNRVMNKLREMHGGQEYDARWHHRMRGTGAYADMVQTRFKLAVARFGLSEGASPLRTDLFQPPLGDPAQMSLF